MPTIMELRARGVLPYPRTPQPAGNIVSTPIFNKDAKPAPDTGANPQKRAEISEKLVCLEPRQPLVVLDDDPVFDAAAAGRILGYSVERMKKWRQRNQGPDYIQYEKNGAVRYELSALMAYRAAHTVKTGRKP
jgi:hypothetical protein